MSRLKRISQEQLESITVGNEPTISEIPISKIDLIRNLNWYTSNRDYKNSQKYISDYFTKNKLKLNTSLAEKQTITFGWICRMMSRGVILSEKEQLYFKNKVSELSIVEVEKQKPVEDDMTNVINIQEKIKEKSSACIGELEGLVDEFIKSKGKTTTTPLSVMLEKNIKGVHASNIVEWFKESRDHFQNVMISKDDQIKEGYSNFTKPQIKKLIEFHQLIIDDAQNIISNSKKTRKPRKRKQKTSEQLTNKVNYCPEFSDNDLKLKSINPKEIVGTNTLWIFNTKTKKLGCYIADDSSGLTVKGSTILNFSKVKSISKNIRKPKDIVPNIVNGGKVFLRNVLADIKAKENKLNGRINKDTILLRVIK